MVGFALIEILDGKRKRATKMSKTEPQWKTVEKVVAMLEKSLAPEAHVRHNIKLPNLKTGHPEQCDVVIEMGQEPRITRTIVEVQKRSQRVKPNDFRGWCQKMRDVGANRLICVSAKPFPRSIKDAVAKECGPTVLLVTLEALAANRWPFQIVNNAIKVYKWKVGADDTIKPNPLLVFDPTNNPFQEYIGELFNGASLSHVIQREGNAELLPVMDLINEGIRRMNSQIHLPEGVHQVPIRWHPKGVSFCYNGKTAPIQEVKAVFKVECRAVLFPFEISSYTQEGHKALAWVARAIGEVDGEDAEIRFTCIPNDEGAFSIFPQVFGIKEGIFLLWGYGSERPGT